jgi:predicted RNA binding protein YcfA (HicA-like mRNA interferase family)
LENDININIFVSSIKQLKMKYSELEKKLKSSGCYNTGDTMSGHPVWYSPKTDKYFRMSHHKNQEVAKGTLNSILKDAGVKK